MNETILAETRAHEESWATSGDPLRDALAESRQRWRDFTGMAVDIAFETDAEGRLMLVAPDTALGWPPNALVGQPSQLLVPGDENAAGLNPFCPVAPLRRQRAWIRRFGGDLTHMSFSVVPLHDGAGNTVGWRGVGMDLSDQEAMTAQAAGRLRRGEVLNHILRRIEEETNTTRMIEAALQALIHSLGADGAAIIGRFSEDGPIRILHESGAGASAILGVAAELIDQFRPDPVQTKGPQGHAVLSVGCRTRLSNDAGLVIWRATGDCPWDHESVLLARSAERILRLVLEHQAFERDIADQARTDQTTGLLNRRAFLDEVRRNIARLDRDSESGTLLFLDLDGFKAINDQLGHGVGDQVLVHFAGMLRKLVRPSDSVARFGGDEFAVWLSGADHMTAAERAEFLCKNIPQELKTLMPELPARLGVSIGIATRGVGSRHTVEELARRADLVMFEVKRAGRSHWRVSPVDGI